VLDLGLPMEQKFTFFSRFKIKLYFNNFPDSFCKQLLRSQSQANWSEADFAHMLPDVSVKYDLILAWDYLDYLTPENLRVVTTRLSQCSHAGTWIYFLLTQHRKIPDQPATIDLLSGSQIRYISGPAIRDCAHYPPQIMEGLLKGYRIKKMVLLKNGIQEHLFEFEQG